MEGQVMENQGINATDIAAATCGSLLSGDGSKFFNGVSIDTRSINKGEAFFAIRGPRFDGHDFIEEALENGAALVVVEKGASSSDKHGGEATVIEVSDTTRALGGLAGYVRSLFPVPLVAVTGTSGKTTTKDMTAMILSQVAAFDGKVLKTDGNRNNLYGVPLTLMGLDGSYKSAVLELGISEEGEMDRLTEITAPDVALITNIGKGHLEGLGSLETTASEKGALFRGMKDGGVMAVNIDDPLVVKEAEGMSSKRRVTYSASSQADVMLKGFMPDGITGSDAVLNIMGEDLEVRLNTPGIVNGMNAAAAAAASLTLGATLKDIKAGLEGFTPGSSRLEVIEHGGLHIIDDTYNANPSSVKAALEILSGVEGRTVAILGDMLELGPDSEKEHFEAGEVAARAGLDMLFAVGCYSDAVIEGAVACGMDNKVASAFTVRHTLVRELSERLLTGDTVLIKGSRGSAMEEIVQAIKSINVSG